MAENVYLFYGKDTYIIKSKTNQIIAKNNIDDFNITTYDVEESPLEEAINDAATIPFMADQKMVIIKNAYFLTSEKKGKKDLNHNLKSFQRYLENPVSETILVVQAPYVKLDERKAITKFLKQNSVFEECKPLKDQDLRGWVKRQLGKNGIAIDADALNEVINRCENNTEVIVLETQKLVLYAEGYTKVDLETVKLVVTKNVEDNVYEITNMLLANNRSKALEIYNDLVMHNEDPLRILGILVNKYREILHTKLLLSDGKDKADVANYFNASPGRAFYIMKNAKGISLGHVEDQLLKLEDLDYKIKTGRIDKKVGLELFILGS
jgi:DNA polymerase-3 subunit delta